LDYLMQGQGWYIFVVFFTRNRKDLIAAFGEIIFEKW